MEIQIQNHGTIRPKVSFPASLTSFFSSDSIISKIYQRSVNVKHNRCSAATARALFRFSI